MGGGGGGSGTDRISQFHRCFLALAGRMVIGVHWDLHRSRDNWKVAGRGGDGRGGADC